MRIGIQSDNLYCDNDPLGSLERIKNCGFDSVDFSLYKYIEPKNIINDENPSSFYDKTLDELFEFFKPLKEASKKTGVIIGQTHAPFPSHDKGKTKFNNYMLGVIEKCLAICEYIECPAMVVHCFAADGNKEEFDLNLEYYRSLIPLVKKYPKVKICIENIFGRFMGRKIDGRLSIASDICTIVDMLNNEAGGDYFGICFDVGHALLTHKNIKDYIRKMGDRLTIMHIHDNDAKEDLHMIPYTYLSSTTEHYCDWQGFIDALKEIGYNGILNFETFRIFSAFPNPVHDDVLRLISSIGKYWSDYIEN